MQRGLWKLEGHLFWYWNDRRERYRLQTGQNDVRWQAEVRRRSARATGLAPTRPAGRSTLCTATTAFLMRYLRGDGASAKDLRGDGASAKDVSDSEILPYERVRWGRLGRRRSQGGFAQEAGVLQTAGATVAAGSLPESMDFRVPTKPEVARQEPSASAAAAHISNLRRGALS